MDLAAGLGTAARFLEHIGRLPHGESRYHHRPPARPGLFIGPWGWVGVSRRKNRGGRRECTLLQGVGTLGGTTSAHEPLRKEEAPFPPLRANRMGFVFPVGEGRGGGVLSGGLPTHRGAGSRIGAGSSGRAGGEVPPTSGWGSECRDGSRPPDGQREVETGRIDPQQVANFCRIPLAGRRLIEQLVESAFRLPRKTMIEPPEASHRRGAGLSPPRCRGRLARAVPRMRAGRAPSSPRGHGRVLWRPWEQARPLRARRGGPRRRRAPIPRGPREVRVRGVVRGAAASVHRPCPSTRALAFCHTGFCCRHGKVRPAGLFAPGY